MQIRITVPVLEYGSVQWTRGQLVILPDDLAEKFVARKEAVEVPIAERATLPVPEHAIVPKTFIRPKPPVKTTKGRRK